MAVEVRLELGALAGIRRAAADAALETMGILRGEVETAAVMPFDIGTMQNDMTAVLQRTEGGETVTSLVSDAPQARRLFYHPEYNYQTGHNPNAGGQWLAPWLPGGAKADFVGDTYRATLERRLRR